MGLLDQILGGGDGGHDDEDTRRRRRGDYEDFVRRYEDGPPDTGYDDDEAYDRYDRVSRHLSRDDYERSARSAVSRMSPQQRRQLGRQLRERVPDFDRDGDGRDDRYEDPDSLARMMGGVHERQPDLLGQLMGGGRSRRGGRDRDRDGIPDDLERSGGGLGGLLGGGGGGGDTLMKMALGGVAAMAVRHVMDQR